MSLLELLLLAVGLSMDAFSVAVCKGLALRRVRPIHAALVGLWFGGFQALMPLLGYLLGARFASAIARYDHWVILILLGLIGANMIREALGKEEAPEEKDAALSVQAMLPLAVATSIDALAAGVTFAFLETSVLSACLSIGAITFVLSAAGVKIGSLFGLRYKARAEICGGVILILLGVKILLEHLEIL